MLANIEMIQSNARLWYVDPLYDGDDHDGDEVEADLVFSHKYGYPVNSVASSWNRELLVTASNDDMAKVWCVVSGNCRYTLQGHTDSVEIAAFAKEDKFVVTGSSDRTARIWFLETSQRDIHNIVARYVLIHTAEIMTALPFPDGMGVITASQDGIIKLWHVRSGYQNLSSDTLEMTTNGDNASDSPSLHQAQISFDNIVSS